MATVEQIKAQIKTVLESITNLDASTIHARRRLPVGQGGIVTTQESEFVFDDLVNTWEIELESFLSEPFTNVAWHKTGTFSITGWYEFNDEDGLANSEDVFADILEDVEEQINCDQSLSGLVTTHGNVQLRRYALEQKGGKLCHVADCALTRRWTHQP